MAPEAAMAAASMFSSRSVIGEPSESMIGLRATTGAGNRSAVRSAQRPALPPCLLEAHHQLVDQQVENPERDHAERYRAHRHGAQRRQDRIEGGREKSLGDDLCALLLRHRCLAIARSEG